MFGVLGFAAGGFGRTNAITLRRQSTDGTGVRLTMDGLPAAAGNVPLVPQDGLLQFAIVVRAQQVGGNADWAVWHLPHVALIRGGTAASTLLLTAEQITARGTYTGQPTTAGMGSMVPNRASTAGAIAGSGQGGDLWRVQLAADTTFGALSVVGTGGAGLTINWSATLVLP